MSNLLEKTGKIVFLRAHDPGTKYGPPNDQLDVEAVFILNAINDGAYGFQLRNDGNLPARQAMFSLLRDAFVNNLAVTADYLMSGQEERRSDSHRAYPQPTRFDTSGRCQVRDHPAARYSPAPAPAPVDVFGSSLQREQAARQQALTRRMKSPRLLA